MYLNPGVLFRTDYVETLSAVGMSTVGIVDTCRDAPCDGWRSPGAVGSAAE